MADSETEGSTDSDEYLGILFTRWLDVFLEYALILAKSDKTRSAYEVISMANDADVFFQSINSMFLIHACWAGEWPPRILHGP